MLSILWHDEESAGYTDRIPLDWLAQDGEVSGVVHEVVGPRSGRSRAKCDVKVAGKVAELDYRPYADFNQKQGMLLGVMRIEFGARDRAEVVKVLWKYKGERSFGKYPVTVGLESRQLQDLESEVAASLKLSAEERRRRLAAAAKKPQLQKIIVTSYRRNPDVVAEVLLRANGRCEGCKRKGPFKKANTTEYYLEVHHRTPLAKKGDDTVENAIALCPNCHREAHYG